MILLIFFLALSVNASEVDINYKWYKYADSAYMTLSESKEMDNIYIDYNDYQLNEYYDIKEYDKIKGRYIYIYNRSGTKMQIESINVKYRGNNVLYKMNVDLGNKNPIELSSKGRIMLDLRSSSYLKDLEVEINYGGGSIEMTLSDRGAFFDTKLALESIVSSGIYKFYNVLNKKDIYYKTYYNRIDGDYRKKAYDDFIYKDINDYKINYFFYNNTITDRNTRVLDLLDTNYTFISYTGEINYDKNGKYNLHLIFKECEKDIIVYVLINDDLNKEIDKLKESINNLNKELQNKENEISELIKENKEIDKLKESINNLNKELQNKGNEINELIEENKEIDKLKESINNLNKELQNKENKINELIKENKEIDKLKESINNLNKELQNKENEINELIEENKEIDKLKERINNLNEELQNKENEININKIIYEKNKKNYSTLVNLKNKCFNERDKYIQLINNKNKEITYLTYKWDEEKDYYKRYIKKLKYVIDEKDVDYWSTKKESIFVGFKTIR